MKYRYTKFIGDLLDELDLEDLVGKLSDLLLSSGFSNPWATDENDRTMQALHDAILDALFNGGVLPDETLEKLLGEPADGDDDGMRTKLEELIQQIIERMGERGYITTPPDLEPERQRRAGYGRAGTEQPFDRLLREHAAVEERVEDGIVQRLHRAVVFVAAVRIAEPARQEQVGQL